jgi:hypothetical protein
MTTKMTKKELEDLASEITMKRIIEHAIKMGDIAVVKDDDNGNEHLVIRDTTKK